MREIIFRGQTRRHGEKVRMNGEKVPSNWIYGGVCQGAGDFSIIYGSYNEELERPFEKHVVYTDTLGEYIGLTDKNGKKIFEGDIIQTTRKGLKGEKTFRFVIKYGAYIPEEYCKEIYNQAEVIGFYAFDGERDFQISNYPKMLEVIGNIHDNPELLGGAG